LLDALARAADGVRTVVQRTKPTEGSEELTHALSALEADRAQYDASFEPFAQAWRGAFEQVRAADADPMIASELDRCQELSEQLNAFLFASAKPLTAMRQKVNAIGELAGSNARLNVLQSDLVRAFETLQTAHHQFEFAAGRISGTEDFRLDAARRSAFGLRRRTQARIQDIDRALERKAAEQARQRHRDALRTTESIVERTRAATDRTVDQLVELQARLNATTETSEAFQDALRSLEVAAAKLDVTRAHLDETQERLKGLQADRLAAPIDTGIAVESCGVVDGPINRADRFRAGGIAFGITFLSIMLGQWWATRRR
jgi:chromosome segregation ATPase